MTAPKETGRSMSNQSGELNWLLDELVERVASIRKALVLSGDGAFALKPSKLPLIDRLVPQAA